MSEWWVKNGDAPNVWDDGLPPGGQACEACGQPTESEPCQDHQPYAFARQLLDGDGLLAELSESPLPGARYAVVVVRRHLAGRSRSLVNPAPARGEPVGSYPPCRSDSACYRNDGHDGDHMYPNEPITYIPAEDMCPNCVTPWKCNGPHLRMSFDPIFEDQTPTSAGTSDEA